MRPLMRSRDRQPAVFLWVASAPASAAAFCVECGAPLTEGAKFCAGCGSRIWPRARQISGLCDRISAF